MKRVGRENAPKRQSAGDGKGEGNRRRRKQQGNGRRRGQIADSPRTEKRRKQIAGKKAACRSECQPPKELRKESEQRRSFCKLSGGSRKTQRAQKRSENVRSPPDNAADSKARGNQECAGKRKCNQICHKSSVMQSIAAGGVVVVLGAFPAQVVGKGNGIA